MKNIIALFLAIFALSGWSCGQQVVINPITPIANSISVSASPSIISVGQKSTLTAELQDTNGAPNVFVTDRCNWSSSNPAILSVSGNIATGVAVGSATANCSLKDANGNVVLTGSTPVSISVVTIVFTNPNQATCASPCLLPAANSGVAYSFTFAATSSAGGPYTWACSVACGGVLPTGLTLSAGGVLSGTTSSVGTFPWTVQVTDGASNVSTLAVSITVNSAPTCVGNFGGPPNYSCASSSTQNPGLISAPFVTTNPAGVVNVQTTGTGGCAPTGTQECMLWVSGDQFVLSWATGNGPGNGGNIFVNGQKCEVLSWNSVTNATILCSPQIATSNGLAYKNFTACKGISSNGTGSGCQNSTGYDTTIPGYVASSGCISVITDGGSTDVAGRPVGNLSASSAGTTDIVSLPFNGGLDHYLAVTLSGGTVAIYHLTTSGNCLSVVNTGQSKLLVAGTVLFSHVTSNVFYYMGANTNGGTYGTQVNKCTITSDTTMTCAALFDYFAGGGSSGGPACPGVTPFTTKNGPGISGIGISGGADDEFGALWSAGIQNTAIWTFDYSLSAKGGGSPSCASANWQTGQAWAFCTSGCGPTTTPLVNPTSGFSTFLGNVSTTTTAAITVTGVQTVLTTNISQVYVGQSLTIDTSTNQETVTVTGLARPPVIGFAANFTKTHASGVAVTYTAPTCWGAPGGSSSGNIHDEIFGWGGYMHFGIQGNTQWSQGTCAVVASSDQSMLWQPGTYNETYMNSSLTYYTGVTHDSMGTAHQIGVNFNGSIIRPYTTPTSPSFISGILPLQDSHTSGWPHVCSGTGTTPNDNCLWISAADSVTTNGGSAGLGNCPAGTSAVYCPNYLNNVFFGLSPTGASNQTPVVFMHTYSCNPAGTSYAHCNPAFTGDNGIDAFGGGSSISAEFPDGTGVCWVSSMLHQSGVDNSGNVARLNVYCARL